MSAASRSALLLGASVSISLMLSSCDQKSQSDDASAIASLKEELDVVERELQSRQAQLETTKASLRGSIEQLNAANQKAHKAEQELASLRKKIASVTEDDVEALKAQLVAQQAAEKGENPGTSQNTDTSVFGAASPRRTTSRSSVKFPADEPLLEALPMTPDEMEKAAMPTVVIIEGDASNGSGFFINEGGKTYLYTAAHVLSGNQKLTVKTTDGTKFSKFGTFEIADGADLARLEILEPVSQASTVSTSDAIALSRPVFAMGNSGGGGVLTVLRGRVTGVGPTEFEVDAGIIQGNSGGPVFDTSTGAVMGVVTHALAAREDIWAEQTRFTNVRRFAARLDTPIGWHSMPIGVFLNERRQIDEIDRGTRLLFALSMLRPTTAGLRMNTRIAEGVTAAQIFDENQDQQTVKDLYEMNTTLLARGVSLSDRDLVKKFASFYRQILADGQRQIQSFDPSGFSSYHREEGKLSIKWRASAEKAITTQLNNMPR